MTAIEMMATKSRRRDARPSTRSITPRRRAVAKARYAAVYGSGERVGKLISFDISISHGQYIYLFPHERVTIILRAGGVHYLRDATRCNRKASRA